MLYLTGGYGVTQREKEIFEKLLITAFEALEQSVKERDSIRGYYINDQMYKAEMAQRGYAYGIYQALVEMNYKHEDLERFHEMLK